MNIQNSFWHHLPRPFFVLAPMEDVTDTVFRRIVAECGQPDVMVTEFTSVEGLASEYGHSKVVHRLQYTEQERPLVAQIWGVTPEHYYQAAKLAREKGFDGLDINMGCPVKKVIKQGACSALIKTPSLATDIIQAAQEGAGEMPVTVKTRLGFKEIQTEEWIGHLLAFNLPALAIHMRTVRDLSDVPARWEEMSRIIALRESESPETLIIGNGDVSSYQHGLDLVAAYGMDGVMIGRGVFSNPWIFDKNIDPTQKSVQDRLELLAKHVTLFDQTWGTNKNFAIMKKFFKVYLQGFPGAQVLRSELVQCTTAKEVLAYIYEVLRKDIAEQ